jgi:isoaspartyl peptidase/L-asparaginase-like protein (Ntn-hydrolase superfamily)
LLPSKVPSVVPLEGSSLIFVGFPLVSQEELVTEGAKQEYEAFRQDYQGAVSSLFNTDSDATTGHDTVGAVAFDWKKNIASGTSTGGITFDPDLLFA